MKLTRICAALIGGCLLLPATLPAQPAYPNRPVQFVVGFPPGGTTDLVARVVATRMSELLGQPIVINNRPGASGQIATQLVKQAEPDGYTVLVAPSDLTLVPALAAAPPYQPTDFSAIGQFLVYPHVLVANNDLPAKDASELIALARKQPGKINFASGGNGGSNHVSGVAFLSAAKIDITHVPYKGNGPALTDLQSNQVQLLFTSMGPVEGLLKSGRIKALGVTGKQRLAALPDVPAIGETAIPGYELTNWYGLVSPKGTPAPIVKRLNDTLREAMASDFVKEKLASIGGDMTVNTPEAFATMLNAEVVRWKTLAREQGISLQ